MALKLKNQELSVMHSKIMMYVDHSERFDRPKLNFYILIWVRLKYGYIELLDIMEVQIQCKIFFIRKVAQNYLRVGNLFEIIVRIECQ